MSSAVQPPLPDATSAPAAVSELSLFRLYTLRGAYLFLALGIGVYYWPAVIHHSDEFAATHGIQFSLLAGIGAASVLGLRYPVQMIPLLLFEMIWKAIFLLAFALPLWSAHKIGDTMAADIQAVLFVVIIVPLVPWSYVFRNYAWNRGDRWR